MIPIHTNTIEFLCTERIVTFTFSYFTFKVRTYKNKKGNAWLEFLLDITYQKISYFLWVPVLRRGKVIKICKRTLDILNICLLERWFASKKKLSTHRNAKICATMLKKYFQISLVFRMREIKFIFHSITQIQFQLKCSNFLG